MPAAATATVMPFDPHTADESDVDGWHRVVVETTADDLPHDPPPTRADVVLGLRHPWPNAREEHSVARNKSGEVVGTLTVYLPDRDNTHLAGAHLSVRPDARGRGVGRALLGQVLERAEDQERRTVVAELPGGGAGERFAAAAGAAVGLTEQRSVCTLADVPADLIALGAADERDGYRLRSWVGPVPEDLVELFAAALAAMNDAPSDDLDWEDEVFDAALVRATDAVRLARDLDAYTAVALDPATGRVAGLTDVTVSRHSPTRAEQLSTAVLAEHRGHGLGLWLKAHIARTLRAQRPDVREVVTWNAASNAHMLAVNGRLGYRPDVLWRDWQVSRDVLRERLR